MQGSLAIRLTTYIRAALMQPSARALPGAIGVSVSSSSSVLAAAGSIGARDQNRRGGEGGPPIVGGAWGAIGGPSSGRLVSRQAEMLRGCPRLKTQSVQNCTACAAVIDGGQFSPNGFCKD
jgi:hypothetical protein